MSYVFILDREKRACVINGTTAVGEDLATVFAGFLEKQLGRKAYEVERIDHRPSPVLPPLIVAEHAATRLQEMD